MPDHQAAHRGEPIAIVGLACRFPDASDPAEFLDLVMTQRRAFRRLPPGRLGLYQPGLAEPGTSPVPDDPAARPMPGTGGLLPPSTGGWQEPGPGAAAERGADGSHPSAGNSGMAGGRSAPAPGSGAGPGSGSGPGRPSAAHGPAGSPGSLPAPGWDGLPGWSGPDHSLPAGDSVPRTAPLTPGAAWQETNPAPGHRALRAALIEGWRFDRAAFGITRPVYEATDPAHWLALETAARALADGGFPGGQGLSRDRTGVIIGNTLTGEISRAAALRSRWPYVRRVIASALTDQRVQPAERAALLARAEAKFLASFPEPNEQTLAGSLPSVIADRICGYFGFRGGGHAVDSAHSSSLLAVAAACSALATGDLDAVVAGGVDISLDPFELAGLASMGVLAEREMRVYDARPSGFWPGEGCGLVVLMRAADARAAGLPIYAQIAGWGTSSAGNPALTRPGSGSLLLALRRAYQRAGVDPADVHFIEGDGTGTPSGDLAELTSLAEIRHGAQTLAAIGSVKANVGHTKAAAGIAGLIKAALVTATGVIPPVTGCSRPHPLIASEEARLRVPRAPEPWPAGTRLAGVSAVGPGGTSVHLVLRRDSGSGPRKRVKLPGGYVAAAAGRPAARRAGPPATVQAAPPATEVFVFSGPGREGVAAELRRVADVAPWLSDAELHDLACQLGSQSEGAGPVRAALVARSQDELGQRASAALALLRDLRPGRLAVAPGVYAADGGRGRVTLLFPGDAALMAHPGASGQGEPASGDPALHPAILASSLASLRLLDRLEVTAASGTGHGVGEIAGLVWAGCLSEADAARLVAQRAALLSDPPAARTAMVCVQADAPAALALCAGTGLTIAAYNGPDCQVLAGPAAAARDLAERAAASGTVAELLDAPLACHTGALADRVAPLQAMLREIEFSPPARRLISTVTGRDLTVSDDLPALLCSQLISPVRFTTALRLAAAEADLLVEVGSGGALCQLAAASCDAPSVTLAAGRADSDAAAQAVAALFAAGAASSLAPLYAGRPARPADIWRDRVFITNPCDTAIPGPEAAAADGAAGPSAVPAREGTRSPDDCGTRPASLPALSSQPPTAAAPAGTASGGDDSGVGAPAPDAPHRAMAHPANADPAQSPDTGENTGRAEGPDYEENPGPTEKAGPGEDPNPGKKAGPGENARPGANAGRAEGPDPGENPDPGKNTGRAEGPDHEEDAGRDMQPGSEEMADGGGAASGGELADSPAAGPGLPGGIRGEGGSAADDGDGDVPGVAPWVRCFTEQLRRPAQPVPADAAGPWRVHAARQSFGLAAEIFEHDPAGEVVLAVVGCPADPETWPVLLAAARQAAGTGRLVVVTSSAGFSGFCTGLHGEQPSLGITLIRTAASAGGLRAARRFATAEPGRLRELVLDSAGTAREPVMAPAEPDGGGTYPLGPADTILISGMTGLAELTCAAALGYRGAALAVLCEPEAEDDPRLSACIAGLRAVGRRVWCESADPGDPEAVADAVAELESGLGTVTAVVHGIAAGPARPAVTPRDLPGTEVRAYLSAQVGALAKVLDAVEPGRLRLLVTFGSVAGRCGQPGGPVIALASEAVAAYAGRRAGSLPACRAVHLAWPAWPTSQPEGGPGEPLKAQAGVPERARLLQQVLASPALPGYLVVQGRTDVPAAETGPGTVPGRFLETVRVYHPAVELVADARLSLPTDPYLADYQIDGLPVLPAVLALEAMAQAGSVLAGGPVRNATQVSFAAPVVVPAGRDGATTVRVCALRQGDQVETVLRCVDTGFRVDHARAVFRATGVGAASPGHARPAPTGGSAAAPGGESSGSSRERSVPPTRSQDSLPGRVPLRGVSSSGGIVDGTDLYGPVCFQSGRFRRVAFLPELTSRSCRALVRGGDDQPWFGPSARPADLPLVLGSPGLSDAALQVLQACLPHRRVLPAGCESVMFSGREVRGALQVHAVRRSAASQGSHRRPDPGRPSAGPEPAGLEPGGPGPAGAGAGGGCRATGRPSPAPGPGADLPPGPHSPGHSPVPDSAHLPVDPHGPDPAAGSYRAVPSPGHRASGEGTGRVTTGPVPVPAPAGTPVAGQASGVWDVIVVDATGDPVLAWTGVRLQDVGPLARTAAWHPSLLAVSLESRAVGFGMDPSLRVIISTGEPLMRRRGRAALPPAGPAPAGPCPAGTPPVGTPPAGTSPAGTSPAGNPLGGTPPAGTSPAGTPLGGTPLGGTPLGGTPPAGADPADDARGTRPAWTSTAPGYGPLDGFELAVRASVPVAARWEAVGFPRDRPTPSGPELIRLRQQLMSRPGETPETVDARLHAVSASLAALGREPGLGLAIVDDHGDGWIVVRSGGALITSAVVEINGVPELAAVAIASGTPLAGPETRPSAGQPGLAPIGT